MISIIGGSLICQSKSIISLNTKTLQFKKHGFSRQKTSDYISLTSL